MKVNQNSGFIDIILVIIGLLFALFLLGFFKSSHTVIPFSYTDILHAPCGLKIANIRENKKVTFPLFVRVYANGCGWNGVTGEIGTVQVVSKRGLILSDVLPIPTVSDKQKSPSVGEVTISLKYPPQDTSGYLVFQSKPLGSAEVHVLRFPITF